jgi:hypothetical protein
MSVFTVPCWPSGLNLEHASCFHTYCLFLVLWDCFSHVLPYTSFHLQQASFEGAFVPFHGLGTCLMELLSRVHTP